MNDVSPAGIGHNAPPFAEQLVDETAALRERAAALIESVKASHISSPETAAAVTTLGGMLKDARDKAEVARKERAQPFDDGKVAVQRAFKQAIIDPLDEAMAACRKMLDAWRMQLAAAAEAERRKRDAEAAEARRAADEAEQKRIEAEKAGDPAAAIKAEMEHLQAAERAERLASDEGTIRPDAMIRTAVGSAGTATERVPTVTNIGLCLRWLIENQSTTLIEAITPLIARLTRAKVAIPGVEVKEVLSTRLRR